MKVWLLKVKVTIYSVFARYTTEIPINVGRCSSMEERCYSFCSMFFTNEKSMLRNIETIIIIKDMKSAFELILFIESALLNKK